MFEYIKKSLERRRAKRVTREYPERIDTFNLHSIGDIRFANWENPLVLNKEISEHHVKFFEKFIKQGDVAIDIGANIGQMTIPMAIAAGSSGICFAFDPNPLVFRILDINASLNPDLTNIKAFNYAITSEAAEFYYHSSEASFNNGGISELPTSRHGKYVLPNKIKGIKLEDFLSTHYPDALQRIKLIKIDTEGYDKEIAKSIVDILKKYRPVLISECFGKLSDADKFDYFDFLSDLGYTLFYFDDFISDAIIIPIVKRQDMLKWKHFDFYALPS
ncbi:MAG: FkbM family methyltransferase [Saprospiraceae bacterium]|nr:FkbM family methyltransferase [Saprospiraceae bacterium]